MSDSPFVFEGTPDNFQDLVIEKSREIPVLVDFWAAWCNPCQMLLPVVTRLAEEYQGKFHLVKVNSDEQQALASQFGVRSLPTLKLFHKGEIVEEIMGAQPEPVLRELLDKYVEVEVNPLVVEAQELLQSGQQEKAYELMQQAHNEEPENKQVASDLIRLTAIMGKFESAQQMIENLPMADRDSEDMQALSAQIEFSMIISDSPEPDALEKQLEADEGDSSARFQLAIWRILEGHFEIGLNLLLDIMRKDKSWQDDKARTTILKVFDMLPGNPELVNKYRRQMFNLLH